MIDAYIEAAELLELIHGALDSTTLARIRMEAFSKHDASQTHDIPLALDRLELAGALRIAADGLRDMAGWLRIEKLRSGAEQ